MTRARDAQYISAYFEAKAIQYEAADGFALREAPPLKCLYCVPGWPEVNGFYAVDCGAAESVAAIESFGAHERHALTVIAPDPAPSLTDYGRFGYYKTPGMPQPLMAFSLQAARTSSGSNVRLVQDQSAMEILNGSGSANMNPKHLFDSRLRYYCVCIEGRPVSWGAAVLCAASSMVYVFGVETVPDKRRRGLAAGVMAKIHSDAAADGFTDAILCASPDGVKLYSALGYETVAYMQMLVRMAGDDGGLTKGK